VTLAINRAARVKLVFFITSSANNGDFLGVVGQSLLQQHVYRLSTRPLEFRDQPQLRHSRATCSFHAVGATLRPRIETFSATQGCSCCDSLEMRPLRGFTSVRGRGERYTIFQLPRYNTGDCESFPRNLWTLNNNPHGSCESNERRRRELPEQFRNELAFVLMVYI